MNLPVLLLKNKLNLFFALAFVPLLFNQFLSVIHGDVFGWMIPIYGFLILLIKKDRLAAFLEARRLYRFVGLVLVVASFFAYYAVVLFYPSAQFYGIANYTIYIFGLLLIFFRASVLKESFTTFFLIVAATASPFVGKWMEVFLQPAIPFFVQIMGVIANGLGVTARIVASDTFVVFTRNGSTQLLSVTTGCIGVYSFLTFSVIMIVTMFEDSARLRTRSLWAVGGVIGTFLVNILRVSLILWFVYYFGGWGGSAQTLHANIGYVLFLAWLVFFFLLYSGRRIILSKIQLVVQRLSRALIK